MMKCLFLSCALASPTHAIQTNVRTLWPRRSAPQGTRHCLVSLLDTDPNDLASQFAQERRRRAEVQSEVKADEEPFNGIREIVLDADGKPIAIPRRQAPPPGITAEGEARELLNSPSFLLGCLATLGSAALLLAIAQADASASL